MACQDCTPNTPTAAFVFSGTSPCNNCDGECPQGLISTSCVYNNGPALLCIGAEENERLDSILNKIDALLCTVSGIDPYPNYNTYCLGVMTDQQDFVETISEQFCTLRTSYNTFIGTTFPAAITTVNTTISNLNKPNITACAGIGYTSTDTLASAITKLSNYICNFTSNLDLSTVVWDQCSTVISPPETIQDGFNFVISQICNISAGTGTALPTFDNTGTCLDTPTSTDSLVSTIIKMRSKVCAAPAFNPGTYTGGCITVDSGTTMDELFGSILSNITSISQNLPTVFNPSQFTTAFVDPSEPCLGKQISLSGAVATDRFVALNTGDVSPGTLEDKIVQGTGISLDFGTINSGMLTISSTNTVDEKVKVNASDPTAGYLEDKVIGTTGTVSISTDTVSNKVQISASLDYSTIVDNILSLIEDDEDLKTRFCALVTGCPSPCAAPQNVQITYIP